MVRRCFVYIGVLVFAAANDHTALAVAEERVATEIIRIHGIDTAARCKAEEAISCQDCMDGWGSICFRDPALLQKTDLALEPRRKGCFGWHHSSQCRPCRNDFEILVDQRFEKVSCQRFYEAINKRNTDCRGCITEVLVDGGG